MIIGDAARNAEPSRRTEVGALDDDALRQHDTRIRLGAGDWIFDRTAVDLDELAAFESRPHSIEGEIVRDGIRPVHLRPRPAQDSPRPADLAAGEQFDRGTLTGIGALVDQDERLAIALMDCTGPCDVYREVQAHM